MRHALRCRILAVALRGRDSPHDDDDKVQHVPAVADVGVLVHDQTVGNYLQERLYGEDDEEGVLHCLLHVERERATRRAIFITTTLSHQILG